MTTCNKEIKVYMKMNDVPYWKLAEKLGVSEATIVRWFRHELPSEKIKEYMAMVDEIVSQKEA